METAAAEYYDKVQVDHQAHDGVDLIQRLSVKEGDVVLDLGCGTGYLSSILADRVGSEGRVIGVDPNKNRIEIAKTKHSNVTNLQFFTGSSETFPSGPYDLVISVHVLHWIEDKASAFRNVVKNLKIGGKFAFICAEEDVTKDMMILNPQYGKESVYHWKGEQYQSLAAECGFRVEFKSSEIVVYNFKNVDEYIEWSLATMGIDPDAVDLDTMSDFKSHCVEPHFDWKKLEFIMKR